MGFVTCMGCRIVRENYSLEESPPHEQNEEETNTANRGPFAQKRLQIDIPGGFAVFDRFGT
jgi:hypothetical protein